MKIDRYDVAATLVVVTIVAALGAALAAAAAAAGVHVNPWAVSCGAAVGALVSRSTR